MEKMFNKMDIMVVSLARIVAVFSANRTCTLFAHQPELPSSGTKRLCLAPFYGLFAWKVYLDVNENISISFTLIV